MSCLLPPTATYTNDEVSAVIIAKYVGEHVVILYCIRKHVNVITESKLVRHL